MRYSHVFWDWNGTLLDDVRWCLQVLNRMLTKRGMHPLPDLESYRQHFGFPIVDYYRRVGFDFAAEPFEALAEEYMALYHADQTGRSPLMEGARDVLEKVKAAGGTQIILTASKRENLEAQLRPFAIEHCFEDLLAIDDIYARSKVQVGLDYLKEHTVDRGVLIGDTLHDYEVAEKMGIDCLLLAQGHHGRQSLGACGAPVLGGIEEVPAILGCFA